jgi:hypothetical protein
MSADYLTIFELINKWVNLSDHIIKIVLIWMVTKSLSYIINAK